MSGYKQIDLSQLPAPDVIQTIDFETLLAARKAALIALYPDIESVLGYESEPVTKLLEENCYLEMTLRQRINDAARAVMLAFAKNTDIEHLAAFFDVERLLITPADNSVTPPIAAVYESDDRLRARTQLALEGFSVAGPTGAYIFHALSASAAVKDVSVDAPRFTEATLSDEVKALLPADVIVLAVEYAAGLTNPRPGDVAITVMSTEGNGTPSQTLTDTVIDYLTDDEIRPLTDHVRARAPDVIEYSVDAVLTVQEGVDAELVRQASETAVTEYTSAQHLLGAEISLSGLYAALHQSGVVNVTLNSPAASIINAPHQTAFCTAISVTLGGN